VPELCFLATSSSTQKTLTDQAKELRRELATLNTFDLTDAQITQANEAQGYYHSVTAAQR